MNLFRDATGWDGLEALPLVGMRLMGVKVDDDKESISLLFPEGTLRMYASGDCCSQSWIEYVETPALGWDGVIADVSGQDEYRIEQDDPTHDCLRFYQQTIRTTKGDVVIEYRNSSNGYYGGSLNFSSWDPS